MNLSLEQIFERKREARKRFDMMSFEEKIEIVERMRRDLAPLRRLREADATGAPDAQDRQPGHIVIGGVIIRG